MSACTLDSYYEKQLQLQSKIFGPVRSEFYTFSPVRSVWSGPKNIHNRYIVYNEQTNQLSMRVQALANDRLQGKSVENHCVTTQNTSVHH